MQEDSLAPRKPNEACDNSSSDEGDFSEHEAEETSCSLESPSSWEDEEESEAISSFVASTCGCTNIWYMQPQV